MKKNDETKYWDSRSVIREICADSSKSSYRTATQLEIGIYYFQKTCRFNLAIILNKPV